jgi:hypothetical protein
VAGRALGPRGEARTGRAPGLADLPDRADTALILDVIHMLDDAALRETLGILHAKLIPGGRLVIRVTIPADRPWPWKRRIEEFRLKHHRLLPHYRTQVLLKAMIVAAGFEIAAVEKDTPQGEEWWLVADRPNEPALAAEHDGFAPAFSGTTAGAILGDRVPVDADQGASGRAVRDAAVETAKGGLQ